MAQRAHNQESCRPPAQTHGGRHFRCNGIPTAQQQIERCYDAQHDNAPVQDDKDYILKYLLHFQRHLATLACKFTFIFGNGQCFAEGTRLVNEIQTSPETLVIMIIIAHFCKWSLSLYVLQRRRTRLFELSLSISKKILESLISSVFLQKWICYEKQPK